MQIPNKETEPVYLPPKPILYLGIGLIAVGMIVALYIAGQVLALYTDVESNTFVAYLIRQLTGSALLADGNHNITIGQGGATLAAVVSFVIIAWAGAVIAFSLIRAGSQLISPVIQMQLAGIKLKLSQLRNEISRNMFADKSSD